jgi:hypothetical protein
MLKGRAFIGDFRFSPIFLSHAISLACKRKRIQFPQPLDRAQPSARVHRNRQRLPSNHFLERAPEHRTNARMVLESAHAMNF